LLFGATLGLSGVANAAASNTSNVAHRSGGCTPRAFGFGDHLIGAYPSFIAAPYRC
jgi:hypothetical protein